MSLTSMSTQVHRPSCDVPEWLVPVPFAWPVEAVSSILYRLLGVVPGRVFVVFRAPSEQSGSSLLRLPARFGYQLLAKMDS